MRKTTQRLVSERTVIVETVFNPDWGFRKGERLLHLPSGQYGTALGFPGRGSGLVNFQFDRQRWNAVPLHRSQFVRA